MKRMSVKANFSRVLVALVGLALFLSLGVITVFAYTRIDTSAETSVTATFAPEQTGPLKDVAFRLYKVAEVSDTVRFTPTQAFDGAAVDLNDVPSASAWADMAVTLLAYAQAEGISPAASAATDAAGQVRFSGLTVGLYLLAGDSTVVGDYAYAPGASMLLLPTLLEDDTWDYAPSVSVKCTRTFVPTYQDVTVKKVWSDGSRSSRPSGVDIQLLRDGVVLETVTLNQGNNWTYTWQDLPASYEGQTGKKLYAYTVNETAVPTGYRVSVNQNGQTFTVTNTYPTSPSTKDPTLPQTGTLNWPIPVLAVTGMALVAAGWYLVSRKREG